MIVLKKGKALTYMRKASSIVADVLRLMKDIIRPGISTKELDNRAELLILSEGGYPAFKGYRLGPEYPPYPASLCVSINEEVVHGIPREDRILEEGDIVSIDVGVKYNGYYGDAAATFTVGEVLPHRKKLVEVGRNALYRGIEFAKVGNTIGDIGWAIESYVLSFGFDVVRSYTGHGIGKKLHEPPQIPNFGRRGEGVVLRKGMTLAIEPMVNMGSWKVKTLLDGWTVVTVDGKDSVHFEHTVLVTDGEPEILTKWED